VRDFGLTDEPTPNSEQEIPNSGLSTSIAPEGQLVTSTPDILNRKRTASRGNHSRIAAEN
jgi:hypothetical protein